MTTQKGKSGRHASRMQRDFASEVLAQYRLSKDVSILIEALEYFQLTGDFSPFGAANQNLKKRAIFHRLRVHANSLQGAALKAYTADIADTFGCSEETAARVLKGTTSSAAVLTGSDALFEFLDQQLKRTSQQN